MINSELNPKTNPFYKKPRAKKLVVNNQSYLLFVFRQLLEGLFKNKRFFIALLALTLLSDGLMAQKTKLFRANKEYEQMNFQVAIPLYLEILEKTEVVEAKANLADAYRRVGNMAEAEYWYSQLVHLPDVNPIHKLYYGKALQQNGKCDLAKEWFEAYSQDVPEDGRGRLLASTCDPTQLRTLMSSRSGFYEILHLPFNTQYDDFGPAFYKDGLVFASERDDRGMTKRIHTWTGNPFLEMFYTRIDTVDAKEYEYLYEKEPGKYHKNDLNTKYHDGPISYTKDYKKVFITRNNLVAGKTGRDEDGVVRLKIMTADLENDKWTNMKELSFNSDEYSVAHPAVSADGKTLYFASDMPGGFGGMDLYVTTLDESTGEWMFPQNLGPAINTEGHEVFPTVHSSGKLYFASDGHIGLGGLDIYYIRKTGNSWTPVMNMGAPLNSVADDFGFMLNEKEDFGYFASDREGGVGNDDIYAVKQVVVEIEVYVYDEQTRKPIAGASVFDACNQLTYRTATNGKTIIELPVEQVCNFTAKQGNYIKNTVEASTKGIVNTDRILVEIPLNKPVFALEGKVYNLETREPIGGATVTLMNDCGEPEVTYTTDVDGMYRFELSRSCGYFVKGEKDNYLAAVPEKQFLTRGKIATETFYQDLPLLPYVTNPEIFAEGFETPENKSVNFAIENIYYNFDKHYIREESEASLDNLIKILTDNPTIIVEIGSHTDSRGSDRYNKYLSRKRAQAVVNWLIERGIEEKRLTYRGYGETELINDCVDDRPCTEEQHQRNRRTEFRIVGTLDGKAFEKLSTAPKLIKVDACDSCPF